MTNSTPLAPSSRLRRVPPALIAATAWILTSAVVALAAGPIVAIQESAIAPKGERFADPEHYLTVRIDLTALDAQLVSAPLARSFTRAEAPIVSLPLPDGTFARFEVYDSPVMAPELQAKFPEIRTFEGHGLDESASFVRFSLTEHGFHALLFTPKGTVWIDPYQRGDYDHYLVFHKADYRRAEGDPTAGFSCVQDADPETLAEMEELVRGSMLRGTNSTGPDLRTYRLAVAATGEYTQFHGGTVGAGLAAIVVAMNRVNGIYQRDLSIFMELIANNNLIVYTNPNTDPYTNNNGGAMLGQNQTNLDSVIGAANYDIGHVFSTGGGGIASLACVCVNGRKAQGVTGLPAPTGDIFYVDYVSHEMGHQYGGTHSFNGTAGSCCCGNRTASTAYEPGSGSTIMAYAGICGSHNIQNSSDDYFHNISFEQIRAYSETGGGSSCPDVSPTGNSAPVADADLGGNFVCPISTPLEISGSGSDPNGDPITYCWEEMDLGAGGDWRFPSGNAPTFRSYDPVTIPNRIIPRINNLVLNQNPQGEVLPTYARNVRMRLTVRDNLGGTSWATAQLIGFDDTAGPFLVTYPNTNGLEWQGGTTETVTWNVANTTNANVNCQNVDILLSIDGGFTYPYTLLAGTPNDGSANVTVPAVETTAARIRVQASNNLFFDISNFNLTITGDVTAVEDDPLALAGTLRNEPNPFSRVTHVAFRLEESGPVSLRVYNPAGRLVASLADGVLPAGEHVLSWDGTDVNARRLPAGVYMYKLESGNRVETRQMVLMN